MLRSCAILLLRAAGCVSYMGRQRIVTAVMGLAALQEGGKRKALQTGCHNTLGIHPYTPFFIKISEKRKRERRIAEGCVKPDEPAGRRERMRRHPGDKYPKNSKVTT